MAEHQPGGNVRHALISLAIDKALTFGAGLAVTVIGSIFLPVTDIIFGLYTPLTLFLQTYIYGCIAVFIFTIIVWAVIWRRPFLRGVLPYAISLVAVVVAGLMRGDILFPNIIGIQFLLFFSGILLLGEALVIHACLLGLGQLQRLGVIHN